MRAIEFSGRSEEPRHDNWLDSRAMRLLLFVFLLAANAAFAAPFTPQSDSEVVERLPASATDPQIRRVDSLRKQLAARPQDVALRLEVAHRSSDPPMAQ